MDIRRVDPSLLKGLELEKYDDFTLRPDRNAPEVASPVGHGDYYGTCGLGAVRASRAVTVPESGAGHHPFT